MKKSKIGLAPPLIFPVLLATLLQLLLPACSSTETVVEQPASKPIREHEEDFDPVEYRKPEPEAEEPQKSVAEPKRQPETVWVERTEKSMGFRVQLYSTTNIDEAQLSLSQLRSRFDSLEIDPGRIDMGYDAPYYKIRAGDFLNKAKADELREQLREAGVLEAWVVRDMVIRIIREEKKD
jgi:cell division septation protein DedD